MATRILCVNPFASRQEPIKRLFDKANLVFVTCSVDLLNPERGRREGHLKALAMVTGPTIIIEDDLAPISDSVTYPSDVLSSGEATEVRFLSRLLNNNSSNVTPLDLSPYKDLALHLLPAAVTDVSMYFVGVTAAKMILSNPLRDRDDVPYPGLMYSTVGIKFTNFTPVQGTAQPLVNGSRLGQSLGTVRCTPMLDLNHKFAKCCNDHTTYANLDAFDLNLETFKEGMNVHPSFYLLRASVAKFLNEQTEMMRSLAMYEQSWNSLSGVGAAPSETQVARAQVYAFSSSPKYLIHQAMGL